MFNQQLLAGRRILVTGGGTGLGKSMASRFLELGAEVHICGRRKSVCDETATELMDAYGGRVVSHGSPYVVPSAMSKSAIHAMTMSLATEWGRYGIRLNTIAPGEIPTEGMSKRIKPGDEAGARTKAQNPMGRVGRMEELQNLAVFLISGGCDWINGETIAMDGGQALAMGGNFYQLRDWSDADWTQDRDAIN